MTNNITYYKVGGHVRDKFLGKQSKDIDFAVEAPNFTAMKNDLLNRGVKIFQERPEFLTIRGTHPEYGGVDYVLARKDGAYTDGRHPDTVEAGTILDDLSRRDFTMNAIAEHEDGSIYDPFDGESDIHNGIVRCVGNALIRFDEDRLRIFRAIRFAVVLGFSLHDTVKDAIDRNDLLSDYNGISSERIQIELWKAFAHDTLSTLKYLNTFPHLMRIAVAKGIRLKPTLEK